MLSLVYGHAVKLEMMLGSVCVCVCVCVCVAFVAWFVQPPGLWTAATDTKATHTHTHIHTHTHSHIHRCTCRVTSIIITL